jgi:putative hemolysin
MRAKRWCFTLNNPTEEEKELVLQSGRILSARYRTKGGEQKDKKITYLIYGIEQASTMTLHFQGYVELATKTSMNILKQWLPRAHWEKAKGTSKQASDYCKKDGDYKEYGELAPGRGKRTDLMEIKQKIDEGKNEEYIADNYFEKWVVYRRSFKAYATLKHSDRHWSTVTHVFWGKTGTGKTRFVMDQVMDSPFWSPGDYKWFDGYEGQPIVIFDDYRGEYPLQMLLKLLDRYPMSVPIKGGFTKWAPKKIYITSNIHPNDWYPTADRFSVSAMFRRLSKIEAVFESLY